MAKQRQRLQNRLRDMLPVALLAAGCSVLLFAATYANHAAYEPDRNGIVLLAISGITGYAVGMYWDYTSTKSFGLEAVRRRESSPLFRGLCRWGFGRALVLQVAIEMILAATVLPILLVGRLDVALTGCILIVFGSIHAFGGWKNSRLRGVASKDSEILRP